MLEPEAVDGDRECCTGFSVSQKLNANLNSAQNASDGVIWKFKTVKVYKINFIQYLCFFINEVI